MKKTIHIFRYQLQQWSVAKPLPRRHLPTLFSIKK